MQLSLPHNIKN